MREGGFDFIIGGGLTGDERKASIVPVPAGSLGVQAEGEADDPTFVRTSRAFLRFLILAFDAISSSTRQLTLVRVMFVPVYMEENDDETRRDETSRRKRQARGVERRDGTHSRINICIMHRGLGRQRGLGA